MNTLRNLNHLNSVRPGTRILFANVPADGHFNPLTGLAMHLKSKGCDVRWYTSVKYQDKVQRLGLPFYPLKRALDIASEVEIDKIFAERKKYKSQVAKLKFDLINVFILRSTEYYEDIKEIHEEFPFELMIADITFGAIPFVKEKMNIPVITISIVPLPETSKDLAPSGLGMTPSRTFAGRIRQRVLRKVADKMIFAQPNRVMKKVLGSHGIDAGKANLFDVLIRKSTVVLQSGTPSFEYERSDMSRHIFFAGPLLPFQPKQDRKRWYDERLRRYEKVLLVTQGTVEKDVEKLLVPTLEAFSNSDCLVIATTGGSQTSSLRERYPQENIIIEDFIPFDDVLPFADVYISNGGYGGVLLSINNQIPMVVAGVHEGKNEINARIGYFELGINLKTETPSVLQLRKSVEAILSNDKYSNNVQRLRGEFLTYQPNEICEKQVVRLLNKPALQPVSLEAEIY